MGEKKNMTTLNIHKQRLKTRKRLAGTIVITFLYVLFSIWFVNILDQVMVEKSIININLDFSLAIENLIHSYNHKLLFFMMQGLYFFLLIQTYSPRAAIQKIDTMKITADIEIPVPAGNGQHGSERFLTETEKREVFNTFTYPTQKDLKKGGVVVQMIKQGKKESLLYVGKDLHTLIIGASGSGKTRRILFETIWLQLLSGISVIVSDVKAEIYYFTSKLAKKLNYKEIVFDLRNPKKSLRYNYLQQILKALDKKDTAKAIDYTWDLVSVLVGEPKGEPLWYNGESASIAAGILAVAIEAPEGCKNLTNVYYFLAYMCKSDEYGNMLLSSYLNTLPDDHPAKSVFAMAEIAPGRTRSSFFTSALGTLRLFTNPNVADMTSESDFDLKDISREKTIVYMIIPDEKKTLYPLVSILITQMYSMQVELANENGLRLPVDTDYDLDEIGNFPKIPTLGNMLSAGRSRGVRANLVIQDFQQLEEKYKHEFKNIRTNCQVKIYLKSDDNETLKWISENLGKYTVEVSAASSSISTDDRNKGMNFTSSSNLCGRALLEPAEIKRIKTPYAIVMISGEYAGITMLPDLSQYKLNDIYGLGREEKENAVIMSQREEERPERSINPVRLWGIWKQYTGKDETVDVEERISFL